MQPWKALAASKKAEFESVISVACVSNPGAGPAALWTLSSKLYGLPRPDRPVAQQALRSWLVQRGPKWGDEESREALRGPSPQSIKAACAGRLEIRISAG